MPEIQLLIERLDLLVKHKKQYYASRPIMRFLNFIGVDRGAESIANKYAEDKASAELSARKTK